MSDADNLRDIAGAVTPMHPITVTLKAGAVLKVTATEGSVGFVLREVGDGSKVNKLWLNAGIPVTQGPFTDAQTYRIKATAGTLNYTVDGAVLAVLEDRLPRATEIVQSGTVVAKAIVEGKKAMSLVDKMHNLADLARRVPTELSDRADATAERLTAARARGHAALDGIDHVTRLAEDAAAVTEDAVNQLTNGAPLPKSS